jgi:sugar phosphate isomerase/epimerase
VADVARGTVGAALDQPVRDDSGPDTGGHLDHRGDLGSGHIDIAAFFGALAEIDYRGPLTFSDGLRDARRHAATPA